MTTATLLLNMMPKPKFCSGHLQGLSPLPPGAMPEEIETSLPTTCPHFALHNTCHHHPAVVNDGCPEPEAAAAAAAAVVLDVDVPVDSTPEPASTP
jgi:hypothetical protein